MDAVTLMMLTLEYDFYTDQVMHYTIMLPACLSMQRDTVKLMTFIVGDLASVFSWHSRPNLGCRLWTAVWLSATAMVTTSLVGARHATLRDLLLPYVMYLVLPDSCLVSMQPGGGGGGGGILPVSRGGGYQKQPHIFGVAIGQYRRGINVANTQQAPPWDPPMIHDNRSLPYTVAEYSRDVVAWCQATGIPVDRQGFLIRLALGGQARRVAERYIDTEGGADCLVTGKEADGQVITGSQFIFRIFRHHSPENDGAMMLHTCLAFFNFTPAVGGISGPLSHVLSRSLALLATMFPWSSLTSSEDGCC